MVVAVPRVIVPLALALGLSGCAVFGEPVELLTGVSPVACYAGGESGMTGPLVVDPEHGTSLNGKPVMWPIGFTGRRVGVDVQVLDAEGRVRATTGRVYHISFAPVVPEHQELMDRIGAYPAAVNCDYAWDFIDCTADPANTYCRTE